MADNEKPLNPFKSIPKSIAEGLKTSAKLELKDGGLYLIKRKGDGTDYVIKHNYNGVLDLRRKKFLNFQLVLQPEDRILSTSYDQDIQYNLLLEQFKIEQDNKEPAPEVPIKSIKPPIGLIPLKLHNEQRHNEVRNAICRYIEANLPVPEEWLEEYNEYLRSCQNH